ncbi:MAG TPA: uroporphyrinogen-III synthase [Candidatus Acidoferrales bacterium]|nr:uroporphyrinogen-III synthase [Candidatus Acidoferrales bacterium]
MTASANPSGELTTKPLAGKRVVVTRAAEQAGDLIRALEENGAEVLLLPSVTFAEAEDKHALDAAIHTLYRFDWLLLTSQNAVRFLSARCHELGIEPSALAGALPRVAAVGPATAEAARSAGFDVKFIASRNTGDGLGAEMQDQVMGKKVLLPRSDLASNDLPLALSRAGADVTSVIAYRTLALQTPDAAALEEVRRGKTDVVTFASPSAFHAFVRQVGEVAVRQLSGRTVFAAIGPVTERAIHVAGFDVEIQAVESTAAGLVAGIISWCSRERASSGAQAK